jgi:hypothetical protein
MDMDMRHVHGEMDIETTAWIHGHGDMDTEIWRHGHEDMDMEIWVWTMETWAWRQNQAEIEAQAILFNPFTVSSSCNQKFVVCPFIDEETNGSYPFTNGLNGHNGLAHIWAFRRQRNPISPPAAPSSAD